MAVNIAIKEAFEVWAGLAGSADIKRGDLVYDDGTDWELSDADADSIATQFAQAVAVSSAKSGEQVLLARKAVLFDGDDNSFSTSTTDILYLSATAGAITSTRPTGANNVKQVVGQAYKQHGGTGAQLAIIDIKGPYEMVVELIARGATSAYTVMDSGNFGGFTLDAQNETALFSCLIPENAIGIEIAYIWSAVTATAGTPTFDTTVGSVISAAQHDVVTADATLVNKAMEGSAVDEVLRMDATTGFDATNIFRPGALLGVKCNKDDAGTDIGWILAVQIVFKCV